MPVKHIRVELLGTLCSGAEVWSAGFSCQPVVGGTPDLSDYATSAGSLFQTQFWGVLGVTNSLPPETALTGAKATSYNAAGVVDGTSTVLFATPSPGTGGGGATSLPPQCAVCVSLLTPIGGRRGRGRMYLPSGSNVTCTGNGRFDPTTRDAWALHLKSFFDVWNSSPALTKVAVASSVGGFVTTVTQIKVGDVVDTQRRRRDALPESYATEALAP